MNYKFYIIIFSSLIALPIFSMQESNNNRNNNNNNSLAVQKFPEDYEECIRIGYRYYKKSDGKYEPMSDSDMLQLSKDNESIGTINIELNSFSHNPYKQGNSIIFLIGLLKAYPDYACNREIMSTVGITAGAMTCFTAGTWLYKKFIQKNLPKEQLKQNVSSNENVLLKTIKSDFGIGKDNLPDITIYSKLMAGMRLWICKKFIMYPIARTIEFLISEGLEQPQFDENSPFLLSVVIVPMIEETIFTELIPWGISKIFGKNFTHIVPILFGYMHTDFERNSNNLNLKIFSHAAIGNFLGLRYAWFGGGRENEFSFLEGNVINHMLNNYIASIVFGHVLSNQR